VKKKKEKKKGQRQNIKSVPTNARRPLNYFWCGCAPDPITRGAYSTPQTLTGFEELLRDEKKGKKGTEKTPK